MTAPSLRFRADTSEPIRPAFAGMGRSGDALDELYAAGHLSGRARRVARDLADRHVTTPVGDILVAAGWAEPASVSLAAHRRWGADEADLHNTPPPRALVDQVGLDVCLRHGIVPWRQFAGGVVLACADPARFDRLLDLIPASLGRPILALASREDIQTCLAQLYREELVTRAETRGEPGMTCRSLRPVHPVWLMLGLLALATLAYSAPLLAGQILLGLTAFVLCATSAQKLLLAWAALRSAAPPAPPRPLSARSMDQAPTISLFVPLLREAEVAAKLVTSMEALRYPRALLEIMLLVEEDDTITRAALGDLTLQPHLRVVYVPKGSLKTKPRAMNFALPLARGEIIGIYDAEDRPEPNQLLKVAAQFASAPPEVACLQGRLAYYNAHENLLSRCFALDYAAWFRLMLPGLAALNMPIPLGGTTLFLRRHVIDKLDGWDAHNVTEDAELGFRLYAQGYRVNLLDSTTYEEANCRIWPWIKQRSRWMKGYFKTWLVLMRRPLRLLEQLGPAGFLHFQLLVIGSLLHALTSPVLWSLMISMLGIAHPLLAGWSADILPPLLGAVFLAEAVSLGVFVVAARAPDQRWLIPWVLAMPFYYLMAIPAVLKALLEAALNPHYWDKTVHGVSARRG